MKLLALLSSGAVLVVAIAQQPSVTIPEPLAGDFAKLSSAKSLKVHFSKRVVGEAASDYTLEFNKPNKFKLTYDDGFVLGDGTNLYEYKKSTNSYTQAPFDAKTLGRFRSRYELAGWEAFFQETPGSDLTAVTPGANKTVKGQDLQTVDVTFTGGARTATIMIDPKSGLTQGFSVKNKGKEYLVLADKVTVGSDPLPDAEFAFVAPSGATMAKVDDSAGFAAVQQLMTDTCMPCHDGSHKRAGVDVSSYDGISKTVRPSDSAGSLLIKAIKGDGVELMPKGRGPMTDDQIKTIAAWIDAGAKNE